MRLFSLFVFLFALENSTIAFGQAPVFMFTAIPNRDDSELLKQFGPLADYFKNKLDVQFVYVPANTYDAAVTLFADNKVKLAWFGGYSAIRARKAVPGSRMIAQGAEDMNFKSYFIAHVSTGIQRSPSFPKDIAGKTMVFGAPTSTSGRLVPEYWIRRHMGAPPGKVFSRVSFSGDHTSTLELIQSGVADIGALNYTVYEDAKKAGHVDETKVKVIWETPAFPDNAFLVRGDVDVTFGDGFIKKLQQTILDLDDKTILKAFARSKFVAADTEQYEFLEEIANQIEAEGQSRK